MIDGCFEIAPVLIPIGVAFATWCLQLLCCMCLLMLHFLCCFRSSRCQECCRIFVDGFLHVCMLLVIGRACFELAVCMAFSRQFARAVVWPWKRGHCWKWLCQSRWFSEQFLRCLIGKRNLRGGGVPEQDPLSCVCGECLRIDGDCDCNIPTPPLVLEAGVAGDS